MNPFPCHDERGFSLIEVLVSAMLVAMAAVGVLAGIDGASHTSGDQRARAAASSLAQQEIERLKALNPTDLTGYVTTPRPDSTDTRSGILFTTSTTVNWRTDINNTQACAGASNGTRYLALTVATKYTYNGSSHTVTQTGQAAVPITGNRLIVVVYKATKDPQPGVSVQLRDASNTLLDTLTTSSGGCVEWDFLAPGTYSVTVNQPGYVTPSGANSATQTATVAATGANTIAFDYDQAATATARFWYQNGAAAPVVASGSNGVPQLSVINSGMTGTRIFGTAGVPQPTLTTSGDLSPPSNGLFPFAYDSTAGTGAYQVYAGNCPGESTYAAVSDGAYWVVASPGASNLQPYSTTTGAPNGTVSDPNGLRLPGFIMNQEKVKTSSGTIVAANARVVFTRVTDAGCPTAVKEVRYLNSNGLLDFQALPFGKWGVCLEWGGPGAYWQAVSGTSQFDLKDWSPPGAWTPPVIDATKASNTTGCG